MKNHNIYISIGVLLNLTFPFLNNFNALPSFIKGLFSGLGICLIIIGIYSKNHDLSKLKDYKHKLFNKLFDQLKFN
ncbi:hypothetical protein AVM15_17200 [Paraclostridium benzoelyticum]|nr:hypothetical protein AVM15_17200 [Paraclostridium benzoelyticum]